MKIEDGEMGRIPGVKQHINLCQGCLTEKE